MDEPKQTEHGVKSLWNKSFILLIIVSLITAMSFNFGLSSRGLLFVMCDG